MLEIITISITFFTALLFATRYIVWKNKKWRIPKAVQTITLPSVICMVFVWVITLANNLVIASTLEYV